jgi:hypothetical protein
VPQGRNQRGAAAWAPRPGGGSEQLWQVAGLLAGAKLRDPRGGHISNSIREAWVRAGCLIRNTSRLGHCASDLVL